MEYFLLNSPTISFRVEPWDLKKYLPSRARMISSEATEKIGEKSIVQKGINNNNRTLFKFILMPIQNF
jgi:hypothetical protein